VQKHLPILIGGGGEKRTLALVAKYANTYNFFGNMLATPGLYRHKCQILDEHCRAIGRDPREIPRSVCLFADIEPDDSKARARRDFLGQGGDQAARDSILFGSPQRIVDGVARVMDQIPVQEVIFCGLTPTPESLQRFDESVLRKLTYASVA